MKSVILKCPFLTDFFFTGISKCKRLPLLFRLIPNKRFFYEKDIEFSVFIRVHGFYVVGFGFLDGHCNLR